MSENATVSLCMIVKNEEKFLESCLNSVKDIVDEMIIVDTGSTDNTVNIAKRFGADVYFHQWNDNFAKARNISISKATKDWILLMDADDIFEENDKEKFRDLIKTEEFDGYFFITQSYVVENNKNDFVYNSNMRLVRNNNQYEFIGAIHEQLSHKFKETDYSRFNVYDILIHHNGYLPSVVKDKKKRERNIPMIQNELDKNPNNAFHNFNLGNEYYGLGDLENAIKCYDIAYKFMLPNSGYTGKLLIKRISCFIEINDYEKALKEIDNAINLEFKGPDLYFYRGYIYQKQKKYTLAIRGFSKAIEAGLKKESPLFVNGCGDFRSYFALGNIYYIFKDYEEAIKNYENAVKSKEVNILVYYKLAVAYNEQYKDGEKTFDYMKKFFDVNNVKDLLLFSLVLGQCSLYDYALKIALLAQKKENSDRVYMEIGKNLIYTKRYAEAIDIFEKVPKDSQVYDQILSNKLIAKVLAKEPVELESILAIKNLNLLKAALTLFFVLKGEEAPMVTENTEEVLKETIKILETILKAQEVIVFEKALNMLNFIESKNVLLELSKMYQLNGYSELANDEALRSIKAFNTIDNELTEILFFCTPGV